LTGSVKLKIIKAMIMKKYISLIIIVAISIVTGCDDDEFLTREPTGLITVEQAFENEDMIFRSLADLYGRNQDYAYALEDFADFFPSYGNYAMAEIRDYPYDRWSVWD